MSKRLLITVLAATMFMFAAAATAQDFMGPLDGFQEVPIVTTPGSGLGCYSLDPVTGMLSFDISFGGLLGVEVAAHIHGPAPAGVNAGVIFPLPLGSPKIGSVGPLNAIQLAELVAGLWYVNVHTNLFPGGEIRGQILNGKCTISVESSTWGRIKALYVD